ncbi:MAG: hypothetical protein ABW202_14930 [Duganella sp.]
MMKEYYISSADLELVKKIEKAAKRDNLSKNSKKSITIIVDQAPSYAIRPGILKGKILIPDDFDSLYKDEIEKMFYGEP